MYFFAYIDRTKGLFIVQHDITAFLQVLACKDSGYDWFEQLLQNVSDL